MTPPNCPKLVAEFLLDQTGKPKFVQSEQARHYKIALKLEDAPPGAQSVTYRLDPSYWDPLREVFKKSQQSDFREEITSFGDYTVVASVSGSKEAGMRVEGGLADLLSRSAKDLFERTTDTSKRLDRQAIEQALRDIREG